MRTLPILLAALSAVACSPEPSPPSTVGPQLLPLSEADLAAAPLEGELGCHFAAEGDMLLIAKGNVADAEAFAQALANTGAGLQRLVAQEPGGFDAMIDGTIFTSEGVTFTVTRTADEPLASGGSPPYPAQLVVRRAGGEGQTIAGTWTCGP